MAETPANTLSGLAPNQAAAVEIVGVGSLPGRVRLISTSINPTTQLGQVRVFVGSDPRLRAGAFGRARIDIAQRCGTAVPLSAVLYGAGGPVVQVVRDGRVESRRVSVGLMAGGLAEIREGLSEGDIVVARAGAFLREGDRVRTVATTEPADQQVVGTQASHRRRNAQGRPTWAAFDGVRRRAGRQSSTLRRSHSICQRRSSQSISSCAPCASAAAAVAGEHADWMFEKLVMTGSEGWPEGPARC